MFQVGPRSQRSPRDQNSTSGLSVLHVAMANSILRNDGEVGEMRGIGGMGGMRGIGGWEE